MVSVLVKIFGVEHITLAEDVVQEALLAAMDAWKYKGMPDNPRAWLYRVAKNKAIDLLRRGRHDERFDFSDPERQLLTSEYTLQVKVDDYFDEGQIKDDFLGMMYACCHPDLSTDNQITFILKCLCGFSTKEVAHAFLTEEDTISKRLYRTKAFFRDERLRLTIPEGEALRERTASVLQAIYQIFNEGYKATHSDQLIRKDLIAQALQLCQSLLQHVRTQLPESYALMALMCYHAARSESRQGAGGELVLLKDQDRGLWNQELIRTANYYLNQAAFGEVLSRYHIEAALAYEHCRASRYEETDWDAILSHYDVLLEQHYDAVVYLNRCLALMEAKNAREAQLAMARLAEDKAMQKYYLYHAAWGEIYARSEEIESAKASLTKAIDLALLPAERIFLQNKLAKLDT